MAARLPLLAACCALLSCSGGASAPPAVAPPSPAVLLEPTDLALLAADYFEQTFCERLVGRFLPLPARTESSDEPTPDAASGRLWVKECEATRSGNMLQLSLSGAGWAWVDQAESGWRLRQYVSFATTLHVAGVMRPHYDPSSRVATLWFVPVATAVPSRNLGTVSTSADNFGAKALDVVTFGIAGSRADDLAREKVDDAVRTRFEERLWQGFTVTLHVPTRQVDSTIGLLAPGERPERPFPGDGAWLANERLLLRPEPGGFHVLGPFAPASDVEVDLRVEQGPGLLYWTECAAPAARRLDGILRGELLQPQGSTAARLVAPGSTTVRLASPGCSWYLLTTARDATTARDTTTSREATTTAAVRIRPLQVAIGAPQGTEPIADTHRDPAGGTAPSVGTTPFEGNALKVPGSTRPSHGSSRGVRNSAP